MDTKRLSVEEIRAAQERLARYADSNHGAKVL